MQPVPRYGPVIVNCRIVTSVDVSTVTIDIGVSITRGALMIAARGTCENSCSPFFPGPTTTCSTYVPGHTLTWSPGPAAVTAAWIVVNCAFGQSTRSLSTMNMLGPSPAELLVAP